MPICARRQLQPIFKSRKGGFLLIRWTDPLFLLLLYFLCLETKFPERKGKYVEKEKALPYQTSFNPWNTWPIELFIWSKYGSDKRSYSNVDKTLIVALTDIMAGRPHRSLGQFLFFLFFSSHFSAIGAFDLIAGAYVFGVYHIGLESHTTCSANNNHASNKGNLRWGRLRNV